MVPFLSCLCQSSARNRPNLSHHFALINSTCSYFPFPPRGLCSKQCPPMSNNPRNNLKCLFRTCFYTIQGIFACQGVLFKLLQACFSLERNAVKVTLECVLVRFCCASHQARVTVMRRALYSCVHVCVACVPSQWGPVHM